MRRVAPVIAVALLLTVLPVAPASAAAPPWDDTFAGDGAAQPGFEVQDWLVRPDGSFVLIGLAWDDAIAEEVWVAAGYTAQGDPDPGFGGGEPVTVGISNAQFPRPMGALRPDGGLVITDYSHAGYEVVVLKRDGSFDTTFGGDGSILFSGPERGVIDEASARGAYLFLDDLAFQKSGRLVMHGWMNETGPWPVGEQAVESSTFLVALTPGGLQDPSFGTGGYAMTGFTPEAWTAGWGSRLDDVGLEPSRMHVAEDDSISLAGGELNPYPARPSAAPDAVARFDGDGMPMTSFGVAGQAPFTYATGRLASDDDAPWNQTRSLATDSAGGVWVSGWFLGNGSTVRLDESGRQDLAFTDDAGAADLRPLPGGEMLAIADGDVKVLAPNGSLVEDVDLSGLPADVTVVDAQRLSDGTFLLLLKRAGDIYPFGVGRLGLPTEQPPIEITLTATPVRDRGAQMVDLAWAGTDQAVDVIRDGSIVAASVTGGMHRDATEGRGRTSYIYKVCLTAKPGVCSPEVTASFPDQP